MSRKILMAMSAVLLICLIAAAGYRFGHYLARSASTVDIQATPTMAAMTRGPTG